MRVASMRMAFNWTCEDCGVDNFTLPVIVRSEDIDREDLKEGMEDFLDRDPSAQWMTTPDTVTCEKCGSKFATYEP